jgi:hypothetical protein
MSRYSIPRFILQFQQFPDSNYGHYQDLHEEDQNAMLYKDIEHYLLNSSHKTGDKGKILCFRQFVRGYNFYKKHYVHKVMTNVVIDNCCYIRSK